MSNCQYDVNDKKRIKMLYQSNRFPKYPDGCLSNFCRVKINQDDYLKEDEFTIYCKSKILPRKMYIYGKKRRQRMEDNNLYLNYWLEVFLKTIEYGKLSKADFEKSNSKVELTIGIPLDLRANAYKYNTWNRGNVIEFISCLFNMPVEETQYEQQDFIEQLMVA